MSYRISDYYQVPAVFERSTLCWLPIFGYRHADPEPEVGTWQEHYHLDLRFVSQTFLDLRAGSQYYNRICFASEAPKGIQIVDMQCMRPWPKYDVEAMSWLPKLEEAFSKKKMRNMVCPHKGTPLSDCPRSGLLVTCPSHGLTWRVDTGQLFRRVS